MGLTADLPLEVREHKRGVGLTADLPLEIGRHTMSWSRSSFGCQTQRAYHKSRSGSVMLEWV